MRSSFKLLVAALLAISAGSLGGCPWLDQPPDDNRNDNGDVADNDNGGSDDANDNGAAENENGAGNDNGGGNDNGDDDTPKVIVGLPAKSIGYDLIGIHTPDSGQYDANCIGCHGDRTNEVALDGVTPAAHSVMQFGFLRQGNERCMACHSSPPDFLSYSAGGLREPVSVERELAAESSCTSCHSAGGLSFYERPPL